MNVSGKSASLRAARGRPQRRARRSCRSSPSRSNTTGSACTHATLTTSFTGRAYAFARLATSASSASYSNFEVLGSARENLAPVAIVRCVDQPTHLARQRHAPRGRGPVAELLLRLRHVDQHRLRRRPRRLAHVAALRGLFEQDLREVVAGGSTDRAGDFQHGRRVGIAAVEGARCAAAVGEQSHELADVLRCGGVELAVAAVRQRRRAAGDRARA